MGDPGLLQKIPGIPALLPQGSGDREQAPAADSTLAGLDAMADLALNHRLAQGMLGGIVRGFDTLDFKEGPEVIGHWQQLLAAVKRQRKLNQPTSLSPDNALPSRPTRALSLCPERVASTSAGTVAQVLVEQQGHTKRCSRCSITTGVIGGISIT
jgi:hypothetical protein